MQSKKYKYPRTPHLPYSPGVSRDDQVAKSTKQFEGQSVVIAEKYDGENTTMYPDFIHARSIDSGSHPSRSYVKSLHAKIKHLIPADFRICGENLYARHTIAYSELESYFMVFSVWHKDVCLSWPDTVEFCTKLGLELVDVWYKGLFEDNPDFGIDFAPYGIEGYVIRNSASFEYDDFANNVAKYRDDFVPANSTHWIKKPMVKNELA